MVDRFRRDLSALIDVEEDRVLVAVSGGGDSLALLLLTHAVLGDRCSAATVDHRLRSGSAAEAAFVADICAQYGIVHAVLTGVLPPRAGRTANISARARLLRYRLLERHAAEGGPRWLATAHHADDQVETLIMRLNRGAGVAGLAGIRRRGGMLIRPLLGWRHDDLATLVVDCGIVPADDPSNSDDRYDRARLRKVLRGVEWLDPERIVTSAAALGDAQDALAWTTTRMMAERCREEDGSLVLDVTDLPAELVRRTVHACIERLDTDCEVTGPALSRLIERLRYGWHAMIGQIMVVPQPAALDGDCWYFHPAPPRRSK